MGAYRSRGLEHQRRSLDEKRGRLAEVCDLTKSAPLDRLEGRLEP